MANSIVSTVNLNNTAYRQGTNSNPFFNNSQSYSVPDLPYTGNNPMRKPTTPFSATSPVNRPVMPVAQPTDNTPTFDPGAAHNFIDSSVQAISTGDGGVGDANAQQGGEKVKSDINAINNAQDKQSAINDVKSDPFYKSGTFWDTMLAGALKAMDGGSASDIFAAAQQGMSNSQQQQEQQQVKLNAQANTKDLLQHYTPDSVANYQATGNPKYLVERSLTLEQQQAQKLADEDRQDQRQQRNIEAQAERQEKSLQAQEQRYNQRQDDLQAKADAKAASDQQKADTKQDQFERREIRGNTADLRKNQTRNTGFEKADKHMEIFDDPKATDVEKAAAWQQGREEIYTAIQASSNAEKNMDKINEMLGRNGYIQKVGDNLAIHINGVPSDAAVKYLRELLHQDKEANIAVTKDRLYGQVNAYVDDPNDKKQVQAAINKVRRASGVNIPIDYNGYNNWATKGTTETESTPSNRGALSSGASSNNFSPTDFLNNFNKK